MQSRAQEKAQSMMPRLDREYARTKKDLGSKLIDGNPIITGSQKIIDLSKDKNTIFTYVSRHHSEYDFIALQTSFFRLGIDLPVILGGDNLLVSGLTKPTNTIKKPLIVDMKKCNLFSLDRQLIKEDSEDGKEYKGLFRENVFKIYDQKQNFLVFFSGRTYSGEKKNYDGNFTALTALHKRRNPDVKHLIVPVEINYERVVEDLSFSLQEKIKTGKLLGGLINPTKETRGKMAAVMDVLSFAINKYQNKGEMYVDFGAPIDIYQKNNYQIKAEINSSLKDMVRITPTSLVAKILSNQYHKHIYKYLEEGELLEEINYARRSIERENYPTSNYLNQKHSNNEVLRRAESFLVNKRAKKTHKRLKKFKDIKIIEINKESPLISFYANMFGHYKI